MGNKQRNEPPVNFTLMLEPSTGGLHLGPNTSFMAPQCTRSVQPAWLRGIHSRSPQGSPLSLLPSPCGYFSMKLRRTSSPRRLGAVPSARMLNQQRNTVLLTVFNFHQFRIRAPELLKDRSLRCRTWVKPGVSPTPPQGGPSAGTVPRRASSSPPAASLPSGAPRPAQGRHLSFPPRLSGSLPRPFSSLPAAPGPEALAGPGGDGGGRATPLP